jgi:predicted nucleic acid-binding protein
MAWFQNLRQEQIFLSAVTLGELQDGIERARKQHAAKASAIETWVDELEDSATILPMDGRSFREASRLMQGKPDDLFYDVMIAATARLHDLLVATRNEKDFKTLGVEIINPFKADSSQ